MKVEELRMLELERAFWNEHEKRWQSEMTIKGHDDGVNDIYDLSDVN